MRATVLSAITLLILLSGVIFLSIYSSSALSSVQERVRDYEFDDKSYCSIAGDFEQMRREFYDGEPLLRLIISDTALLEIDYLFSDIIKYADAENREGIMASAGRLTVSLEHLIDQSSLNLISIL